MDFRDLVAARRSVRAFAPQAPTPEQVRQVVRAALFSPTSKNRRDWKCTVVEDPALIRGLARCKDAGAAFLEGAPYVAILCGVPSVNDCWVEDCSAAAAAMLYQAAELGLGACWVQIRGRVKTDPDTGEKLRCEDVVKKIVSLPDGQEPLCAVAIGIPAQAKGPRGEDHLLWDSVTWK